MIQQVNKHKVGNFDIHKVASISKLLGNAKADIFYSDPPWGNGNIKYWDTINKKQNDIETSTGNFDAEKFLDIVLSYAVKHTNGWVIIEYGKRWEKLVIAMAEARGLKYCGSVETLYGSKPFNVMDVHYFRTDKVHPIDTTKVHHTVNNATVQVVFDSLFTGVDMEDKIGIDLCCGLGLTAKACISHNMKFIGNELNKHRLQSTLKRLEKDG